MISRVIRNLSAVWLALAIPPLVTGLSGGADFDLTASWRVSWYAVWGPLLAACGAALSVAAPHRRALWQRLALLLGVAQVGVALFICYGVALRTPWLTATTPLRPAAIGAGLVALGVLPASRALAGGAAPWRVAPLAVALGLIGVVAAPALDGRELRGRILSPRPPAAASGDDVVLVVVDTLRADALGSYGALPSPTPFLDALAERSLVLERSIAQAPWTFASMATLMTARHPSTLDPAGSGFRKADASMLPRIDDRVPRLAGALRAAGYHTAAFQKNGFLAAGSGFEVGFDFYEMVGGDHAEEAAASQTTSAVLRWADTLAGIRGDVGPFFLYVHYMDPHVDYRPPEAFRSDDTRAYRGPMDGSASAVREVADGETPADDPRVAQMRRLYRDEVRYLDAQLARLFGGLEARGLIGDDTLVVVTADHGEQFGEHGGYEHSDLNRENVQVPLLVRGAGLAPGRVAEVVGLIDLAPTLLELLELPPLEGAEGRSLAPLLRGGDWQPAPAFTEFGRRARVTTEDFSFLQQKKWVELYAAQDPGETRNLAREDEATVEAFRRLLEAHRAREIRSGAGGVSETRPIDPETRAALEALGYL